MTYVEIFEINQYSTQEDVKNCLLWIEENYNESKFQSISIIIKRTQNQHNFVEQQNQESVQEELLQLDQKRRTNRISLKKVTLSNKEKQKELKMVLKSAEANTAQLEIEQDGYQKTGRKNNSHEKLAEIKIINNEISYHSEQLKELNQMVKQSEQLLNSRSFEQAIEAYTKIQSICKQMIEQQEEENHIAYQNHRAREIENSYEDEKDKERDQVYLDLVAINISNYIKLGRCQLIQKRNDAAIHFFEQGVEFYKRIKGKKLIVKKYHQDLIVDYTINPTILQELFSSLGDSYQNSKVYEKSIENFQIALSIIDRYTEENHDGPKLKGNLYNFLGLAFYCLGNIQKAIDSFRESLSISLEINGENDIQVANRMNNLAEAFRNDRQYDKALQYFFKSLDIKKQGEQNLKSIQGQGKTCLNIGITYQDTKDFGKAIDYYLQAVDYYKSYYSDHYKDEGGTILIVLYTSLAECYKEINNFPDAAKYYEKVYEINKSMYGLKNKQTINCANSLATLLFKLQLFEKSVELFEQILSFQRQYHGEESIQVVQTLINMGTIFCKMKKYELGIEKIDMALKILESNPNSDQQIIENTKQSRLHYLKKISQQKSQTLQQSRRDLKIEEL